MIKITRASLQAALAASQVTYPTVYLITDAVSGTKDVIIKTDSGLGATPFQAYDRTNINNVIEGTYDIGADTFTAGTGGGGSGVTSLDSLTGALTLGGVINGLTAKTTPVDADTIVISDSAASNASKKVTWANIKAALNSALSFLSSTLADGKIFVGNGSNVATAQTMSGDVSINNTAVATIANDAVTYAKMQNVATDRLLGRDTAASGDPEELTVSDGIEFTGSGGIRVASGVRPWTTVIIPWQGYTIVAGTYTITTATSHMMGGIFNSTSDANGDELYWNIVLDAGTYSLDVMWSRNTNRGIMDFYFYDPVSLTTIAIGSIDQYGAALGNQMTTLSGAVVTAPGKWQLRCKINGKNASSSTYKLTLQVLTLHRTA